MTASPTPPHPMTATVAPGVTFAVRSTAPIPVSTPHPSKQACESGELWVDAHEVVLAHEHLLGEAGEADELVHRFVATTEAGRGVRPSEVVVDEAAVGPAAQAVGAMTAVHREARDHAVTGPHVVHARPDRLDDAGGLVTEDERRREHGSVAVQRVQVAVAHARCRGADEHLAEAWTVDLDVADVRVSRYRTPRWLLAWRRSCHRLGCCEHYPNTGPEMLARVRLAAVSLTSSALSRAVARSIGCL